MLPGSLLANITDSLLTPTIAIWLVAALIAATLLFGAINRRRNRLTETLREFVDQNQMTTGSSSGGDPSDANQASPAKSGPAKSSPAKSSPAGGPEHSPHQNEQ